MVGAMRPEKEDDEGKEGEISSEPDKYLEKNVPDDVYGDDKEDPAKKKYDEED
jgi:hypothetical protein